VKEPLASRLLFPITERAFTYRRYDEWLEHLGRVVPLRELAAAEAPVVGLRHDVDDRLGSALVMARLEHARGVRSTYFVLHTAPYWRHDERVLDAFRELQSLGHEVGFHHDLLAVWMLRVDVGDVLRRELDWLRGGGIDVRGTAAHGSPVAHAVGIHNNYFFRGWDEPLPGFGHTDVPKLDPSEFGLEYEAYHLPYEDYVSDSSFEDGRRVDPTTRATRGRAVVLVHPDHWDAGVPAKTVRLARKATRRASRLRSRR
jgi:hypothetical protein